MALTIRTTDRVHLDVVNDWIHDCWFDVSYVWLDEATSTLRVPFERESSEMTVYGEWTWFRRKARVPVNACCLRIGEVQTYRLEESEDIGRYNLNRLEYHAPESKLVITTGIPLLFEILISSLSVTVEITDEVLREIRYS